MYVRDEPLWCYQTSNASITCKLSKYVEVITKSFYTRNGLNKLCGWWHYMPRPSPPRMGALAPHVTPSRRNVAVVSNAQYVLMVTATPGSGAKATVSKAARWPWPLYLESGVRVTCDVGYLCANFGLPRPLCSRLRPNLCDRQTPDSTA